MTDIEQFRSESSDGLALSALTVPGLLTSRLANGCSAQSGRAVVSASASDDDPAEHGDTGLIVAPDKPKLAKPPLWKVVMLNDDYTPMEFVVEVLQTFFGMNGEKATQIMLMVHRTGKGTCGIFPKDIAETKCAQVNQYAQESQHPLVSEIEPADDE